MKTIKETLELALEAMEDFEHAIRYDNDQDDMGAQVCCGVLSCDPHTKNCKAVKASTALREALTSVPDWASEAIEQPAQRTWVNAATWRGLTDEERDAIIGATDLSGTYYYDDLYAVILLAEGKLKEKNSG